MKGLPTVTLELTDRFTPDMEVLRREFSDEQWPDGSSEDRFDAFSSHIVLSVDNQLAGMVRLTKQPPSVLAFWAIGSHYLPESDHVVEATRAVVAKKWRGMSFYKILMTEATVWCHASRVPRMVGAIEVDFSLRGFLSRIGFCEVGEPTLFLSPPKGHVRCIVIVQEPTRAIQPALAIRQSCIESLEARGFCVRSLIANGRIASKERPVGQVTERRAETMVAPAHERDRNHGD